MTQVFVSHASVDKHSRIRPVVHALLLEGVSLWVDRPGFGPSHLGFDTEFIRRHGIGFLKPGRRYQEQIRQALKHSSFVLACLSRGLLDDRAVLNQEVSIGWADQKLVTCVVDDLQPAELATVANGRDGLPDLQDVQWLRIDTEGLAQALDWLAGRDSTQVKRWPKALHVAWQPLRMLAGQLNSPAALGINAALTGRLLAVPIGPAVPLHDIPPWLIDAFAARPFSRVEALRFIASAMGWVMTCNPEGFTVKQMCVGVGELPMEGPSEALWWQALSLAGRKSRRSLAAMLLLPGSPAQSEARRSAAYLHWLRHADQPRPKH